MGGSERVLAGLLRIVYVLCGGAAEGEDRHIVDGWVFSLWIGGTESFRVLAGLVRIVMPMRGRAWGTAGEIARCSSGLLKLFVAAASERVISQVISVAVEQEAD